ncbi:MAG: RnfABCDGE type electron transport complex subunit G [Candidatus Omnitrophota bacterium]
MKNVILKYGVILFVICLITSAFLSGAYYLTKPRIEKQRELEEKQALDVVMPQAGGNFEEVKKDGELLYYKCFSDQTKQKLIGFVFKAQAKGYSSRINILAGVDLSGKITGIKILSQEETPGLGARITEPQFYGQFAGKKIDELVVLRQKNQKNIEAITGATISSEAVTKAVRERAQAILEVKTKNKK